MYTSHYPVAFAGTVHICVFHNSTYTDYTKHNYTTSTNVTLPFERTVHTLPYNCVLVHAPLHKTGFQPCLRQTATVSGPLGDVSLTLVTCKAMHIHNIILYASQNFSE